jgi:hypothetical protein
MDIKKEYKKYFSKSIHRWCKVLHNITSKIPKNSLYGIFTRALNQESRAKILLEDPKSSKGGSVLEH